MVKIWRVVSDDAMLKDAPLEDVSVLNLKSLTCSVSMRSLLVN